MGRKAILLSGEGGQGILFTGQVLCLAAMERGKKVASTPTYGAAMRGDSVQCGVIFADQEIYDPIVEDADIVVCLNDVSLKKYGSRVKEGGILICAESEKAPELVGAIAKQFQLLSIPLDGLARSLGKKAPQNMIALGVYLQLDPDLDKDDVTEGLKKLTKKKRTSDSILTSNLEAIQAGADWYSKWQS